MKSTARRTGSTALAPLANQRGFTIPEAILAIALMLVSLFGLLSAYSATTGHVERTGIERQALALMQREYETLQRYSAGGQFDMVQRAFAERVEMIEQEYNGERRELPVWLAVAVSDGIDDDGLAYQEALITLRYDYEAREDTLTLPARFYRDRQ